MVRVITIQMLKDKDACSDQVAAFQEHFGLSTKVTKSRLLRCASIFDWDWAALHFLSATASEAYDEAVAPASKAYREAVAPASKAYREARATASKAYREVRATASEAYDEAVAPASKAYDEARAIAFGDAFNGVNQ